MAICKDCLHYDVCDTYLPTDYDTDEILEMCAKGKSDEITNIEDICNSFKDKYRYVEIPCYCKECEHYQLVEGGKPLCDLHTIAVCGDYYCSYGERSTDNG
jgi:hypothetical protein